MWVVKTNDNIIMMFENKPVLNNVDENIIIRWWKKLNNKNYNWTSDGSMMIINNNHMFDNIGYNVPVEIEITIKDNIV